MADALRDELAKLIDLAGKERVEAREISPEDVTVADWVRYKCAWGCRAMGFNCEFLSVTESSKSSPHLQQPCVYGNDHSANAHEYRTQCRRQDYAESI